MQATRSYLHTLARVLLALIFVVTGVTDIFDFEATAEMMSQMGFPLPSLFLTGTIILKVGGGAYLLIGFKPRLVTIALIAFLIPATLLVHASQLTDPVTAQAQLVHVLKNLAIIGGLLEVHLVASPDGPPSQSDKTRPDKKTSDRIPNKRTYEVINSPYVTIR